MNYMEEIAKILGLSLGEEFTINEYPKRRFRLTKYGLEEWFKGDRAWSGRELDYAGQILQRLCVGAVTYIKLPFEPKVGDDYYTFAYNDFTVIEVTWMNNAVDYIRRKVGACFRTPKEAATARPKIYKDLTGQDWKG